MKLAEEQRRKHVLITIKKNFEETAQKCAEHNTKETWGIVTKVSNIVQKQLSEKKTFLSVELTKTKTQVNSPESSLISSSTPHL